MPVNAQIGNVSYVLCAVAGGMLAILGNGSVTIRDTCIPSLHLTKALISRSTR